MRRRIEDAPKGDRNAAADAAPPAERTSDRLTGLADREALQRRLIAALGGGRASGRPFALLSIDLDHFKRVNDTLGHPVGDRLLVAVAGRLRHALREDDLVARISGDEFMVLQEGGTAETAVTLAARIVDLVGRSYLIDGHLVNIGASVGIAVAPADGQTHEELLRHVDLALYAAKAAGRSTFELFKPEMAERMAARRRLELELRAALAAGQFELHYQPQLDLASGEIAGFEALLRWNHPERGLIPPGDFIPLAEETQLIVPIGEWAIRAACVAAAGWPETIVVAVNVSPVQFKSAKLCASVAAALSASGLSPRRLELEITEGVLLENNSRNIDMLNCLRALGVRIAMDDFGIGYSSLSYLMSFPFDRIKIDRSFVENLGRSPQGEAVIRAVATLGASLGIETTAEGVERLDQVDHVREHGCSTAQGFFVGRPLSESDATALCSPRHVEPLDAAA